MPTGNNVVTCTDPETVPDGNWAELLKIPTGNNVVICTELETTPLPNAVVGTLPLCNKLP